MLYSIEEQRLVRPLLNSFASTTKGWLHSRASLSAAGRCSLPSPNSPSQKLVGDTPGAPCKCPPRPQCGRSRAFNLQGTPARPGSKGLLVTVQVANFIASALTVGFWIDKTYNFRVRRWEEVMEYFFAVLFGLDYFFRTARRGFTFGSCFSKDCILDVVCAVPLALQGHIVRSWLSISFLRALAVLWSFEELLSMNVNIPFVTSDLRLRVASAVLRLLALLFVFAGSMYIFEFLGNPPHLHDSYVAADMGEISFHSMAYMIMVTISTIGYGDYSPNTLLGRTFLLFVILGGVAFFSFETSELLSLRALEASGRGSFRPKRPGKPHVLVCGGAVASGSVTLADFLHELCHPLRGTGEDAAPEVVVMASSDPQPSLRKLLARRFAVSHVSMLTGSPLVPKDLKRARAATADMALVLADLAAADPAAEDEETVLAAAAMHRLFPALPLRVMLIRQDSKRLAVTAGLPRASVVAAHELSPRLMALAIRVPGAGTLLSNLVRLTPPPRGSPCEEGVSQAQGGNDSTHASFSLHGLANQMSRLSSSSAAAATVGSHVAYTTETGAVARHAPRWLREYAFGAAHSLHGVLLGPQWHGMSFHDALVAMFESHGILLVAVQYEGAVVLNPQPGSDASCLVAGCVAFALGLSAEHVAHAASGGGKTVATASDGRTWRAAYHNNAEAARAQALARARAEALARLAASRFAGMSSGSTVTLTSGLTLNGGRRPGTPGLASLSTLMASMQLQQQSKVPANTAAPAAPPVSPPRNAIKPPAVVGHRRSNSADGLHALTATGAGPATPGAGRKSGAVVVQTPAGAAQPRKRRLRREYVSEMMNSPGGDKQPSPYGEFSKLADVQAVADNGGHTVLVSLDARPAAWAQIGGILEALRQPYLPDVVPVVVVCTSRPPAKLASRFVAVYFVDALVGGTHAAAGDMASTDWGTVLLHAGVDTSERVLYLAGEPPTRDEFMIDRRAVLFATLLETYHGEWNRDVFAAIELHNPNSVWHLRQSLPEWEARPGRSSGGSSVAGAGKIGRTISSWLPSGASMPRKLALLGSVAEQAMAFTLSPARRSVRLSMGRLQDSAPQPAGWSLVRAAHAIKRALGFGGSGPSRQSQGAAESSPQGVASRTDSGTSTASNNMMSTSGGVSGTGISAASSATSSRGSQQAVLHARFASGRVLFRTDVARLFAAAFYTPGVVELLSGLADPVGEHQSSQLWRVELSASPLARFAKERMSFSHLLAHCASEGVLPLALMRSHTAEDGEGGGGSEGHFGSSGRSGGGKLPYCVTCPHPENIVRPSDVLFVLAPAEWARINAPEYEAARLVEACLAVQAAWRAKMAKRKADQQREQREREARHASQERLNQRMEQAAAMVQVDDATEE